MLKYRPYQQKLIDNIMSMMKKGHNKILCYMAMRGGKTVVFSGIAQSASKKGNRVLIITERKKLFGQTQNELRNFGIEPYMIAAGTKNIPERNVYVAMPITLKSRVSLLPKIDIVIYDECHRTIADWIFQAFKESYILGFTGSPQRSGKQTQLGDLYSTIAMGPNTIELEKLGHVLPLRIWKVESPDLDGVQVADTANGKEFNNQQMFDRFDSPVVYSGCVDNWKRLTPNTTTLVYCCNIIHAVKTCIAFNESNIKAYFLTSDIAIPKLKDNPSEGDKTKHKIKTENYLLWKNNQHLTGNQDELLNLWGKNFHVLINVDFFTFGFNHPSLQTVVLNRATLSLPLYIQMANRSCTPFEGQNEAYLLDMGGNIDRLQEPNYPHEWSLFHDYKETKGGESGYKECPKCISLVRVSDMVCDLCGFAWPKTKEQELVELVEHKYNNMPLSMIDTKEMSIAEMEEFTRQRNYKKQWMFRQLVISDRIAEYAKIKGHSSRWLNIQVKLYKKDERGS